MENEINNSVENTVVDIDSSNSVTNDTYENITVEYTQEPATLDTIHQDLGFICTFLILFSVLIVVKLICKFFNIFF